MNFQILDANYTYDHKGFPVVQLFGPTTSGATAVCSVTGFRPYFYAGIMEGMLESAKESMIAFGLEVQTVSRFEPIGFQPSPTQMLRITLKDPKDVRVWRERIFEIPGVRAVYETDILFKNRFLIDKQLGGMAWAKLPQNIDQSAVGVARPKIEAIVQLDELSPVANEANAPLRYMAFDIECLPNNGEMPLADRSPVILISMAFQPAYKGLKDLVLVGRDIECLRHDVVCWGSEQELLKAFVQIINEFDPDIIAGYNSNEFDIPYLDTRAKVLNVPISVGRDESTWLIKKIATQTSVSITGRVVVDILPILRSSFSLKQYTLRAASMELLGMEKYDVDPKEIEGMWKRGGEELRRFISYSRRDAVLAMELLSSLRLMDKYIALSRVSGSLLQDVANGGQSGMVESLLLRRFMKNNRVVPPKPGSDASDLRYTEGDELKGGAVLVPEKGLVENVVILDYKSLYPTIMMAHNLCYSTVLTGSQDIDAIVAPSGGKFVSPRISQGIMPAVLRDLLDQRVKTKHLMKSAVEDERGLLDAQQYALKILLNSFYGYSGYARARLYSLALANAVTSFGRENILRTKRLIEEIGYVCIFEGKALVPDEIKSLGIPRAKVQRYDLSVVYGDTDSVFVRLQRSRPDRIDPGTCEEEIEPDEGELIGSKIAKIITASLPEPMELVFEAFARRGIFLAKKRYALWVFEKGGQGWKDRIKVRGMETVRRDWCELTSKTLNRCLELLLKEGLVDEAVDHVRSVIDRIQHLDLKKDRDMLEDLTLTRRYTKSPSSYKSKQPHIQLVEKMRLRGGRIPGIGDRVPFVIVRGENRKTLFVDRAEDPDYAVERNLCIDTEYYIEKQLLPPVLRIFDTFGISRGQLVKSRGQKNLLDFGADARASMQRQRSILEF